MNIARTLLLSGLLLVPVAVLSGQSDESAGILGHELDELLSWMTGEFDNRLQVERGVSYLATAPVESGREPGLLYPVFARVHAPALGEHVVYLQWPIGSPDGRLQRQRLWSFRIDQARNAIIMDFYTLREADRWRDAQLAPDSAVSEITTDDVIPYPPACGLPFRRHADVFIGEIPPGECLIVSQETRTEMTINARVIVGRDQLWYDESGVRPDGTVVFRVPTAGSYQFRRRDR